METITSTNNPKIKELRKLHERKQRDRSGLFFAEGEDMLAEALRHGCQPEQLFCGEDAQTELQPLLGRLGDSVEVFTVRQQVLAAAGSLGSGSRLIGTWSPRWVGVEALAADRSCVFLEQVSDPGNVGAVVRSALAFGVGTVVLSPQTADPYGPKAVRASMGAVFGQPIARADFEQARGALRTLRALALVGGRGVDLRTAAGAGPALFVLGAEREGLPDRIVSACDEIAKVPLEPGGAESLNVAMVATLCLYEDAVRRLPISDPKQTP